MTKFSIDAQLSVIASRRCRRLRRAWRSSLLYFRRFAPTGLLRSRCSLAMMSLLLVALTLTTQACLVNADTKALPLPRFASIKSNEVNARTGPSIKSPIEWVFVKKGEPVEIIAEYEQWRQIRDIKGEGGWVHSSVLSGKRFAIVIAGDTVTLFKKPDEDSRPIVKISPKVRCALTKCKQEWCRLKCQHYEGWALKSNLFGVYEKEEF